MKVGKWLGNIVYAFDQFGNAVTAGLFGQYAGEKDETWSSAMGKQLAVKMYKARQSDPDYDPKYPARYPVGKFANWICNQFEKDHSLKSIEWDEGYDIEAEYPGIKETVRLYLERGGSKNHRGLFDIIGGKK